MGCILLFGSNAGVCSDKEGAHERVKMSYDAIESTFLYFLHMIIIIILLELGNISFK